MNFEEFYASLGTQYDIMTSDATRWQRDLEQYKALFQKRLPKRVLDAGCGTGGEAITLAKLGCEVIGVDGTEALLEIARQKSNNLKANVSFFHDDLRRLKTVSDESVDCLVCRGNTLPHLNTLDDLKTTLKSFHRVMTSDGLLLLQWINYPLLKKQNNRLVGVSGNEQLVFLRFYDFPPETNIDDLTTKINFNIIVQQFNQKWQTHWLNSTLTPWKADDVGMLLVQQGFRHLEISSDLTRSDFDPDSSHNVVLFAVK